MDSSLPTSLLRPLPYVPLEVKHDILRFCDPSTLAKTSRVSLAFLELSSPLLYRDIHLQDAKPLSLLFSMRTTPSEPQIERFLSLDQIQTLAFNQLSIPAGIELLCCLDRSSFSKPLRLDLVDVRLGSDSFIQPLHPSFSLLNPIELRLDSPFLLEVNYPDTDSLEFGWARLQSLTFVDGAATCPLGIRTLVGGSVQVDLKYKLSSFPYDENDAFFTDWVECVDCDVDGLEGIIKTVNIEVASAEVKVQVEEGLKQVDCWPSLSPILTIKILSPNASAA